MDCFRGILGRFYRPCCRRGFRGVEMRRYLRLALYYLAGILIGAVSTLTFAEVVTYPEPVKGWSLDAAGSAIGFNATYQDAGVKVCALYNGSPSNYVVQDAWSVAVNCSPVGGMIVKKIYAGCAPGVGIGNQQCQQTLPDCVAPQVRDPVTLQCAAPPNKCDATKGKFVDGWVEKPASGGYSQTVCIAGCSWKQILSLDLSNPQDERVAKDGKIWGPVSQEGLGTECGGSGGTAETPPPRPKDTPKKPPCAAGEGVIGTTTGKVLCLPEGTPEVRKPAVTTEKKAETYPDGSKKETETTTTRDPVTNNKDVSVSVTATPGPTGGTQAGTPGTTTSSGQTSGGGGSGQGNGDGDGDCDPTLNFCGGPGYEGIYTKKEKTLGSVLDTFKNEVSAAPVVSSANGFLTATVPSGSCPSWVVTVPLLNVTLDLGQYFCTPGAVSMMDLAGAIILAGVTFLAFRWAIL